MSGRPNKRTTGVPPCASVSLVTLALVVAGGVYLASELPQRPALAPAWGIFGAAVASFLGNWTLLARARPFDYGRFRQVFGWTLIAYLIQAGMIEYVFLEDQVRGQTLAVLSGLLAVFALAVPFAIAFTVARYSTRTVGPPPSDGQRQTLT